MKSIQVLLFEDETSIAENIIYALQTDKILTSHCKTAVEGLELLNSKNFDLVILDVGLPDLDGFQVCQKIREHSQIPIFFLTARSEEVDRILGLELGADDYLTKPFSPRELSARIKAFFRRFQSKDSLDTAHGFQVKEEFFQIFFDGKVLDLRKYEFLILQLLIRNPGKVYSRAQIMEKIWTDPDMSLERTVDTHIKVIRHKLKEITLTEWIITHRGLGYSLKENLK